MFALHHPPVTPSLRNSPLPLCKLSGVFAEPRRFRENPAGAAGELGSFKLMFAIASLFELLDFVVRTFFFLPVCAAGFACGLLYFPRA